MKGHCSSQSLGANLAAICPKSTVENNEETKSMREIEMLMEGLDEEEPIDVVSDKKRRLRVDQVRALEKNFEVENKIDAERKVRLAQELGLQPRQVAVWFQNRRARWKTKQLERDYSLLKANYDGLKITFEKLQLQNQSLLKEFEELKVKINEDENIEGQKVCNGEGNVKIEDASREGSAQLNSENLNGAKSSGFGGAKDGSSDSNSSALLNEDNSNNNSSPRGGICSSDGISQHAPHQFLGDQAMKTNCQLSDIGMGRPTILGDANKEHNFFGEESCTNLMFSDDHAPSLHWYSMMSGSEEQDSLRLCFDRGIS